MNEVPEADDVGRGRVVFVHGSWMHTNSWQPWIEQFDRSGYDCASLSWPGESSTVAACRDNPSLLADVTFDDIAEQARHLVAALPTRPIVLGHGLGGLVALELLRLGHASAAIALAPQQSTLAHRHSLDATSDTWSGARSAVKRQRAAMPSPEQFHRAYASTVDAAESGRLHARLVIPTAGRPLMRTAVAGLRPGLPVHGLGPPDRGPLLLVGGGRDALVREASLGRLERRYRRKQPRAVSDYQVFPDRGHSMAIDGGWRAVAYFCLDWLTRQNM